MSRLILVLPLLAGAVVATRADALDDYVRAQMQKYQVPGLSMAIVDGGKIVETRCYGVLEKRTNRAVTPTTLFQAGSISKSVAALGALRLVEQGVLTLDEDVNVKLKSWKVPENSFTLNQKVTLRRILSHTAGMTVHGFPGYAVTDPKPTLIQVLNGEKPANTPPIVVDTVPGTIWRYSGGGYTVMQQLVLDVTQQAYAEFMKSTVLGPAGMTDSSYEPPQPPDRLARTAAGTRGDGSVVPGRLHVYPEMAAAGLWTTPTDLARFIISVQNSFTNGSGVISQSTAVEMLKEVKDGDGLGFFLSGKDATLRFSHNGRDEGFDADYEGYATAGKGIAVMINANEDSGMVSRIVRFVAGKYDWPGYQRLQVPPNVRAAGISRERVQAISGYYNIDERLVSLTERSGKLELRSMNALVDELLPQNQDTFLLPDIERTVTFPTTASGAIFGLKNTSIDGKNPGILARICGLPSRLAPAKDPDPKRTAQFQEFFTNSVKGGDRVSQATYLTAGAQHDFKPGVPDLAGFSDLTYLGENDLSNANVARHRSPVAHVIQYRIRQSGQTRYVIVYLTKEHLITDFDVVTQ